MTSKNDITGDSIINKVKGREQYEKNYDEIFRKDKISKVTHSNTSSCNDNNSSDVFKNEPCGDCTE